MSSLSPIRFRLSHLQAAVQFVCILFLTLSLSASTSPDTGTTTDAQWLIRIRDGADPQEVAAQLGADYIGPLKGVRNYYRVRFYRPLSSGLTNEEWRSKTSRNLEASDNVTAFEEETMLVRYPRTFSPKDPLFPEQWHLENVGQSGGIPYSDTDVRPAWDMGLSGQGVTIAVVDEGIQYKHPDLFGNYLTGSGHDFNDDDNDPSPSDTLDRHGTAVAGISLALSNQIDGLGIAYNAKLVPLRLIAGPYPAGAEAEALSWHNQGWNIDIYNNSWGPSDDAGVQYADCTDALKNALADNVNTGRGGKGNIYVWAAGNGGLSGDNSNYDGYNALPYTISVGALEHDNIKAGYSEPGANLLVVAPSGGIVTTDIAGSWGYSTGDTYDEFNGTSAAAPMVTGVVALMLQERPSLNWRDVQQILARTAVPVDFSTDNWERNGAGLWVSHDYGFGRVDAAAAVQVAHDWPSLPTMARLSGQQPRQLSLPNGITREGSIGILSDMEVQFVRVTVQMTHSAWGDLRIVLISPEGTTSVLSEPHASVDGAYYPGTWTYLSTRCLGESSKGNWRLQVTDDGDAGSGSWYSWAIQILGHDLSGATNHPPEGEDLSLQSTSYPVTIDASSGMSDPDGDSLQIISLQHPNTGSLSDLGNGQYSFTMGDTKDGSETFSVLFSDGRGGLKRRLVRVLDPRPVAHNDLFPVKSGQPVDLPALSNDFDPDGDSMRLVSLSGSYTGTATIVDDTTIRYTAPEGFSGVDRIQYTLTDDSDGESSGWITVIAQASSDVALKFDGEDDHVVLSPTTGVDLTDTFTAEAWIYPESYGEYVTGFGRIYDRNTFVFFLNGLDHAFYNDRSLVAYVITSDGQAVAINSAANVITLNAWQHVAISYNSSDSSLPVRMYVNGNPVSVTYPAEVTTVPPNHPISSNSEYPLYMGESDSGARAFKGRMTEFRIWDRVLSPATIKAQSDIRLTGNEAGLSLYLPLNQTLEPEAISTGSFKGSADIYEAQRVPMELPWANLEAHYTLINDTGSGWWEERTLGWIYGDKFPWVYLPSMHWVYTGQGEGKNNYILFPYGNNWGWLQTTPGLYPWFYRYSTDSWLWYVSGTTAPAYFYDFGISDYVTFGDPVPGS